MPGLFDYITERTILKAAILASGKSCVSHEETFIYHEATEGIKVQGDLLIDMVIFVVLEYSLINAVGITMPHAVTGVKELIE